MQIVQIEMMDYRHLLDQSNIITMQEDIEILPQGSDFENTPIFGSRFKVQHMGNPSQFLPQYMAFQKYEPSCVQGCYSSCGWCCICLAYPFAMCCCKCCCVYELSTSTAGIVEQFGKFNRLINPGFNMINPCTEQVREVNMKIQLINPGINQSITKDNVKLTISSSLAYRVVNPILAFYILGGQLNHALVQSTHSAIRNVIGQNLLDQILTHRDRITESVRKILMPNVPQGVAVQNIFIEDIVVPPETLNALSSAAKQRRISEATIINSKADVQSASLLKQAAELLDTKAAMQIRYLEMVTDLGKKGAKLLMPIGVNKTGANS